MQSNPSPLLPQKVILASLGFQAIIRSSVYQIVAVVGGDLAGKSDT